MQIPPSAQFNAPPTIRNPDPIDIQVGLKIRARRKHLGMSQETLAEAIDLTFQQVQKYERASNRVSASKLYEIARALNCQPADLLPPADWSADATYDADPIRSAALITLNHPNLIDHLSALPDGAQKAVAAQVDALWTMISPAAAQTVGNA